MHTKHKEMTFWQTFKRFFEPFGFDKIVTIKALLPGISLSIIRGILLIILKDITNAITLEQTETLTTLLYQFGGFTILYYIILISCRNWTHVTVRPVWRREFYKKYMTKYLQLDNNETEKIGTGRLIAIIDKGFHTHVMQLTEFIFRSVPKIIQTILSFIFIFLVNVQYGLIVLGLVIILMLLIGRQQYKAQPLRKERKELNIGITRRFVKILMSKFEVLSSNKSQYEVEKLAKSLEKNRLINVKDTGITIWTKIGVRVFIDSITVLMVVLFGFGLFTDTVNVGEFASLIGIVYFLDQSLNFLRSEYSKFLKNFVEIEKLRNTFDTIPRMQGYDTGKTFSYTQGNFVINNLSFAYVPDKPVFTDFSLKIAGGTKIAFIGESGGGKSTLIKLLAGYIRPNSGRITIDGQTLYDSDTNNENINNAGGTSARGVCENTKNGKGKPISLQNTENQNISLQSYYKNIGYLSQDPSVFDGTIRENLLYGLEIRGAVGTVQKTVRDTTVDDTDGRINDSSLQPDIDTIIRLSKCEFIYDFADGLDTEIGERGVRLSGGQKQRLAIAKIMLKNPNIILLDEPTSALDSFNEELITEALHNLFVDKTVIIVAHRLQTVKEASQILFFENGKVVEQGTHTELLQKNGKYKKMLTLQSGF